LLPFLQQFGIKIDEQTIVDFDTFSPGDLEMDTDFDIVAEWRNPLKLRSSRIKDAILTKMFEWMEKERYEFYPSGGMKMKANLAYVLRRLPLFKKKLIEKFPLNMKPKQLKLFMVLEEVGAILEEKLEKFDNNPSKPKTFLEMYQYLENFRLKDLEQFNKKKSKSVMHPYFRN